MKTSKGLMIAMALGTIGSSRAIVDALDVDSEDRRRVIIGIDPAREEPKYGPGTGKVPEGFEPTARDIAKIAAAEEKRARRHARDLRNLK